MMNKSIFLDRDGTICEDKGYTYRIEDLVLLPNVAIALKRLKLLGYMLIVITNQSGVARGYYTMEDVIKFNKTLNKYLYNLTNIQIDAFFICPHYEYGVVKEYSFKCKCRKPEPYFIYKAANLYNIDLKESYFVGDKQSDIIAGKNAGLKGAFLIDYEISLWDVVQYIEHSNMN